MLALSQDRQPTHESFTSLDMEIENDLEKLSLEEKPVLDAGGVPFSQALDPFPATSPTAAWRIPPQPSGARLSRQFC